MEYSPMTYEIPVNSSLCFALRLPISLQLTSNEELFQVPLEIEPSNVGVHSILGAFIWNLIPPLSFCPRNPYSMVFQEKPFPGGLV